MGTKPKKKYFSQTEDAPVQKFLGWDRESGLGDDAQDEWSRPIVARGSYYQKPKTLVTVNTLLALFLTGSEGVVAGNFRRPATVPELPSLTDLVEEAEEEAEE